MNIFLVIILGFATIFISVIYYLILCEMWAYLFDLVFKTAMTVLGIGLGVKGLFLFIHWCVSNNYEPDYDTGNDLFSGATYVKEDAKKELLSPTLLEKAVEKPDSSFDFTIKEIVSDRVGSKSFPPGSQGAIEAWKNSEEKKALEKRKFYLESEIAKQKSQIFQGIRDVS